GCFSSDSCGATVEAVAAFSLRGSENSVTTGSSGAVGAKREATTGSTRGAVPRARSTNLARKCFMRQPAQDNSADGAQRGRGSRARSSHKRGPERQFREECAAPLPQFRSKKNA